MNRLNSRVLGGPIPDYRSATIPRAVASLASSDSRPRTILTGLLIGLLVFQQCLAMGCAASASQRARQLEPMLAHAGFRVVPADTAARIQWLDQMTPLKLSYVSRNGTRTYWLADPHVCHCLYVGSQQNYNQFEQLEHGRAQEVTQESEQRNFDHLMESPAGQIFYGE